MTACMDLGQGQGLDLDEEDLPLLLDELSHDLLVPAAMIGRHCLLGCCVPLMQQIPFPSAPASFGQGNNNRPLLPDHDANV